MTIARPTERPLRAALLLGMLAQALFAFHLTTPTKEMFDEVHYVRAARILLSLAAPANIEHPLLGKEIIAGGILLFGDDSFGWRIFSTLAGTGTVLGVFAILWLMFRQTRTATIGALLALTNFTVFVQARIAMLDGFMAAFTLLGIAALLWSMRTSPRWAWPRWMLGSALLGLAVASKWVAAPFVAYAAIGFVAVRLADARATGRSVYAALNAGRQRHWAGMAAVPAILALGVVSIAVYFLTFAPAFYYRLEPLTLHDLLPFQLRMYQQQTQVLPHHTYQSPWWTWPLMIRPIWYLYEKVDGAQRGVLMIGNVAVLWGGLVAVAACLWAGMRGLLQTPFASSGVEKPMARLGVSTALDTNGPGQALKLLAAGGLWLGAYLPWIVIPKSLGFFYYYYLPSILLCVALAAALEHFPRARKYDEWFVVIAAGLFAWFYPILSAAPLGGAGAFRHWMWFSSWP